MNERGELTTETIVRLVLIIAGIAIVLGVILLAFDFSGLSDTEACRLSVIQRATVPASAQPYVPLKCRTQKICLTEGGECDEFKGEEGVVTIKLSGDTSAKARMIEKETANAMFDCWSLMGQGKLDLFGSWGSSRGLDTLKNICVICSRVALKVSDATEKEINVNRYMEKNLVPGTGLTYLQIFTDRGVQSYPNIDEGAFDTAWATRVNEPSKNILVSKDNKQIAFVFSQIKSEDYGDALKSLGTDGLVLAGGAFLTPGIGKVARTLILTKAGLITAVVAAAGVASYAALNVYQGQQLAAGYCGEFTTTDSAKKGCSLVSAVPYTVGNINNLCQQIQGSP